MYSNVTLYFNLLCNHGFLEIGEEQNEREERKSAFELVDKLKQSVMSQKLCGFLKNYSAETVK